MVRNRGRFHTSFTQFPPMIISYKTTVKYYNKDISTNAIKIQTILSLLGSLMLLFLVTSLSSLPPSVTLGSHYFVSPVYNFAISRMKLLDGTVWDCFIFIFKAILVRYGILGWHLFVYEWDMCVCVLVCVCPLYFSRSVFPELFGFVCWCLPSILDHSQQISN